jgi:hypothetical protein
MATATVPARTTARIRRADDPGVLLEEDAGAAGRTSKILLAAPQHRHRDRRHGRGMRARFSAMSTWTEQLTAQAAPAAVLEVLTDPGACERWAPVDFELRALNADRLQAGTLARVEGRLAGRGVGFDVTVIAADEHGLRLRASGPIALDVEYRLRPVPAGSEVVASVGVRGEGLTGRVLAHATAALLAAGALREAVARIAREAEHLSPAYAAAA